MKSLKTYIITGEVTITVYTIVKAKSPKQAVKLAQHRTVLGDDDRFEWVSDAELPDEPQNLRAGE